MICARLRLAAVALGAFAIGTVIYLLDRPPTLLTSFLATSFLQIEVVSRRPLTVRTGRGKVRSCDKANE